MYSRKSNNWAAETADTFRVATDARNHTPLAVVNTYQSNVRRNLLRDSSFLIRRQNWIVVYVTTENTLACLEWNDRDPTALSCVFQKRLPNATIASYSRHLSAKMFRNDSDTSIRSIIFSYEDALNNVNVVHGILGQNDVWQNMTSKFLASARTYPTSLDGHSGVILRNGNPELRFAGMCSVSDTGAGTLLYCLAKNDNGSSSGVYTIPYHSYASGSVNLGSADSWKPLIFENIDRSGFTVLSGGLALWSNGTTVQWVGEYAQGLPAPSAPFPYPRLCSASAFRVTESPVYLPNETDSYVYHQINDSAMGEEHWDGSGFWQPSRIISIRTS